MSTPFRRFFRSASADHRGRIPRRRRFARRGRFVSRGRFGSRGRSLTALALVGLALACGGSDATHTPHDEEAETWAVTAWGELYEVFPEVDALVAGEAAQSHTHVTIVDGFAPLTEGEVEIVLRGEAGEAVFRSTEAVRPGIFDVELRPERPGEYDVVFRIRSAAGTEELPGGRVRVGTADSPGGLIRPPAAGAVPAPGAGEPVDFLKEQQWRTAFATAWVTPGALAASERGLARFRPRAGGEATVTAPVDGVVAARPWPHPGAEVRVGQALFHVAPRVAAEQSLGALAAEVAGLETELAPARARADRLDELVALEAVSRREVEEARARVVGLEARLTAARRDLATARAVREGRSGGDVHSVRAPIAGQVAAIVASPGAAVAAGEPLARIVSADPVWVEVELAPAAAHRLVAAGVGGLLVDSGEGPPWEIGGDAIRLISVAPEVDPATGTVTARLEVRAPPLALGTTVEAEVLLAGEVAGIVVPVSALVDDAGVTVVYVQLSGEGFLRQEVEVTARQGDRALVTGLAPGQRLVTRGGEAIRRTALMATGETEGHHH